MYWGKPLHSGCLIKSARWETDKGRPGASREEVEIQNNQALQSIPVTDRRLLELKECQDKDAVCTQIKDYVRSGWPSVMPHQPILKPYWDNQQHFTINDGLLMLDTWIVIPQSLQLDILDKIHQGHLGITKCKGRAHSTVWWPGITVQVESMCKKCLPCSLNQSERKEPLLPMSGNVSVLICFISTRKITL